MKSHIGVWGKSRWVGWIGSIATLAVVGCGSSPPPTAAPTAGELVAKTARVVVAPGGVQEKSVVEAEQAFSVALMQKLAASSQSNVVVSPSSLALALAMLEVGARGSTETQIAKALGTTDLSSEQQATGWNALSAELAQAGKDDGVSVESANSLWLQRDMDIASSFLATLGSNFGAGVWPVDFASNPEGARGAINTWVSDATHGKIPQLFDKGSIDQATKLILANAVYFNAKWVTPFSHDKTGPQTFHRGQGGDEDVSFMHNNKLYVPALHSSAVDAVQLPYQGNRFAALVVMPKSETLSDFIAHMTDANLSGIVSGLQSIDVDLSLPKLKMASTEPLNPVLQSMGMQDAFTPGVANFTGITSTPPLNVSAVLQKATLTVDEEGTEAAAATGIDVGTSAILGEQISIVIDHPFLFLIRDTTTGAILFAAEVTDPAAS